MVTGNRIILKNHRHGNWNETYTKQQHFQHLIKARYHTIRQFSELLSALSFVTSLSFTSWPPSEVASTCPMTLAPRKFEKPWLAISADLRHWGGMSWLDSCRAHHIAVRLRQVCIVNSRMAAASASTSGKVFYDVMKTYVLTQCLGLECALPIKQALPPYWLMWGNYTILLMRLSKIRRQI